MLDNAKQLLKKYYGYSEFRSGQEKSILSILNKKDTFAIMPTGAGKSICYQIPALMMDGVTVVISPLISLMKDQVDFLNSIGVNATYINSSLSNSEVEDRLYRLQNGGISLIYIAPERLESQSFCGTLSTLDISLVAIDEAHCVSQWGHDFRPSYRHISKFIKTLSKRPIVAAFTATATEDVKNDVVELLNLIEPNIFVTGFDRENLYFSVVKGENKKDFINDYINENKDKVGIIYAATRKEVDSLYEMLQKKGFSVGRYHAGLNESERSKNQEAFIYDDINIIVATNAFGMGIDKSNVRYVVHYNMPKNMEAYYQEAGRAGRDGEKSDCILLFSPQDVILQKYLIEQNLVNPERKTNEYRRIQLMADYCHTQRCLRGYILDYFGETDYKEKCDNCSTCNDETESVDVTLEAQKIFSCIVRMKQRFGATLVALVLKGSKNKKVLDQRFNELSTYGLMKEYSEKDIKDMINMFIAEGYLFLTENEFPVIKLTERAIGVIKGEEKIFKRIVKRVEKVCADNTLLQTLKELRKSISEREKVPPYIIFPDTTLREMSEYFPLDEEELLSIKGVGEAKLQRYGNEFLDVIKTYVQDNNITPPKILKSSSKINSKAKENKALQEASTDNELKGNNSGEKVPSHIITFNMYREGKTLEEICKDRSLKIVTVQDHIIKSALEGADVDLSEFIPEKYKDLIFETIKRVGGQKLRPIKDELPEEVDYMSIKAALCCLQAN